MTNRLDSDEPPIIECEEEHWKGGRTVWVFDCGWCEYKHVHSPEPGHRVAHCKDGSPYRHTGYILKLREKVMQ